MRNYWKQFEEWVTGLRDDLFVRTRLKLATSYVVTIIVLLLVLNAGLYFARINFAEHQPRTFDDRMSTLMAAEINRLNKATLWLSLGVVVAAILVGYFFADISLYSLRQTMQAQKRFIADASHELRTPLSVMKTNSEITLMEGPNLTAKEAGMALKSNLEEIDRMSNIIKNLIHLAHIDTQTAEMPFSKVNISDVVLKTSQAVQRMAEKKRIRLTLTRSHSAVVWGNVTALEELILNLLKNAITYTPEGGSVSVIVKNNHPHNIEVQIEDTGIGISPKDLPHIFEPFFKADKSRIRRDSSGSSGLGLTIVREIVKNHNGSIYVRSALEKGTAVTITFPSSRGFNVFNQRMA